MKILLKESTKEGIIDAFAKALDFPAYYSRNWDSFEEIMSEMVEERRLPKSLDFVFGKVNRELLVCFQILADQGLNGSGEVRFIRHSAETTDAPAVE